MLEESIEVIKICTIFPSPYNQGREGRGGEGSNVKDFAGTSPKNWWE